MPILIVGGVIALIVGSMVIGSLLEQKRTERLRLAAEELGLEFSALAAEMPGQSAGLPLFSMGRGHKYANVIRASTGEVSVKIVDFQYTIGHGKSRRDVKQTVACISSPALALPVFQLRPELFTDKIAAVLGQQDIDFADSPTFSKMFLLRGTDEAAIRALFHEDAIFHFQQHAGLSVEGAKQSLIVFRAGKRADPRQLRTFLEDAYRVYALFRQDER
ncbi:MAG: hypothetical protein AB7I37_26000 [Pirellulales bacterium]